LLLVYEGVNLAAERLRDVPGEVLYCKHKPVLKEVMGTVDALAARVYGGRRHTEGLTGDLTIV
jgi:uncharacterized protein